MFTDSLDFFLESCGAAGPLRLAVARIGPRRPAQAFVLRQPFALVGRHPAADVPLPDPAVGQRHLYLQVVQGKVFAIDLLSRSGTWWPTGRRPRGWFPPHDWLGVGPFRLKSSDMVESSEESPLDAGTLGEDRLPAVRLQVIHGGSNHGPWRMNRVLALVGKFPACKVRLRGASVSRLHCSLVRTPAGVWVVDLGGKGGIRVNDVPRRAALLGDGDFLQLGAFTIRVLYESRGLGQTLPLLHSLPLVEAPRSEPIPEPVSQLRTAVEGGPGQLLPGVVNELRQLRRLLQALPDEGPRAES